MSERFSIELPANVTDDQRDDLVSSLREIDDVQRAEVLTSRSVDAATITLGVQLATQVGGAIAPIVDRVIEIIRGRQIKGVELTFPGGVTISADEISGKDLKQLLEQLAK
jgi:hypothetical protein